MSLSAFLKQNAIQAENIKFVASKRFIGDDEKPEEWEIKAVSPKEDEAIRKSCTKRIEIPGMKGQYTSVTDTDKYVGKLAVACTVYPDLNNKELQDSYGVMGADELLKVMLLPGEYADYVEKVQNVCGYEVPQKELVDEVKN